jgi:glycosyltransferase involved in cell wall biosynthesis
MKVGVHITHEVFHKIGGIGPIIHGLCTTDKYKAVFEKTVLYGPLFSSGAGVFSRLGKGGEVLYSNHDNYDCGKYHSIFLDIIKEYNIDIVYGKRSLVNEFNINKKNTIDIILVGVNKMNVDKVNLFKHKLWENFTIASDRYSEWDYEQFLRIGVPYLDIISKLYPLGATFYHFSHEYMGIPSLLSLFFSGCDRKKNKTIFYAHAISPCRHVTESLPGHDITFYNTMHKNKSEGRSFEEEYGMQYSSYRTELVKRSSSFDRIFTVSDLVKDEYQYLIPDIDENKLKVVYNGIPLKYISHEEKLKSRNRIQTYISNLYNFIPDIIFTHVTRLVPSKGIWRDISLLYILDELFHKSGIKGAYILLSTLVGTGREASQISSMEKEYGWPIIHKEGWPDLIGAESETYSYISHFNSRSKSIKGIFINQFGFDRRKCGEKVPEEANFLDLRIGSDVELGFSIYEPFGKAQLEVLPFGGTPAVSSSCGCSYLVKNRFQDLVHKPYVVLDFIGGTKNYIENTDLSSINVESRFELEQKLFLKAGKYIFINLPKSDSERLRSLDSIQERFQCLGWEKVAASMNFPGL